MKTNAEINALVAEALGNDLTWTWGKHDKGYPCRKGEYNYWIPDYCGDIKLALELYEKCYTINNEHSQGDRLVVGRNPYISNTNPKIEYCTMYMNYDCLEIHTKAETMPKAIALAFLKENIK